MSPGKLQMNAHAMRVLGVTLLVLLGAFYLASPAHAQVYTKFGPATGVLKGSTSTYQTTAAASSDIVGLFTGCSGTNYLGADGACHVVGGGGTVSSVALTMPTGFSVSGSPLTTSGTLAVTTTLSGVLKGTGSAFTTAASADIIGLWTGTCSASTFLRGDGACASAGGGGTPGGSNTQVQFNNSGAFGGDAGLTWDNTNKLFTITGASAGVQLFGECNSSNSANVRCFSQRVGSGSNGAWALQPALDNGTLGNTAIIVTRDTSANVTGVFLSNATDNAPVTFSGTGAVTMGGGVVLGAPTGGNEGPGTINVAGNFYVNGSAVGGGAPGGSNTQIQFNDSGVFNGDANFTWDKGTQTLTLADATSLNATSLINLQTPTTAGGPAVFIGGATSGIAFGNATDGYGWIGCPFCLTGSGNSTDFQIEATFDSNASVIIAGGSNTSTASFNDAAINLGSLDGTTVISGFGANASSYIDMTPDEATFTWSFQTSGSSCLSNGTDASVKLHRMGKVVTGIVLTGGTCSITAGGSVSTTNTPVPAGFRPTASVSCGVGDVTLSAGGEAGWICVSSSGNILAQRLGTVTTVTIGVGGANSFTYTLD